MPPPETDFILAPAIPQAAVSIGLDPAMSLLNDLMFLNKADHISGVDGWLLDLHQRMTPAEHAANRLVTIGLHFALIPEGRFESFPAYLDALAAADPALLSERLLERLLGAFGDCDESQLDPRLLDPAYVRADLKNYLAFLDASSMPYDRDVETQAYHLFIDPPAMQQRILDHLGHMWEKYLAAEWARVQPMLAECVRAFQQIDFSGQTRADAVRFITEQDHSEKNEGWLDQFDAVVCVPSAHTGPYLGKLRSDSTLWLFFGVRQPQGVRTFSPDLSRSELLVWLNALADDTRLRILNLLADEGELCAQDIINTLELSQSAASRHLRQLSATGYLAERRREGAKCYTLNPGRVERTVDALSYFLLSK